MTNLDIQSAYLGLDPVDRVYLGVDVVWSGEEPAAYIDPDFFEPLSFKISASTAYYWYFTGKTSVYAYSANMHDITYTINDGTPQNAHLSGYNGYFRSELHPSKGNILRLYASTSGVSGYGYYDGNTTTPSGGPYPTAYHNFAGQPDSMHAYIYGNIKSLLFTYDEWAEIQTLAQTNPVQAKQIVDNKTMSEWAFAGLFQGKNYFAYEFYDQDLGRNRRLVLPETLSPYALAYLFADCVSNTSSGASQFRFRVTLPAKVLPEGAYYRMFAHTERGIVHLSGRSIVSTVTCLATDISASACTGDWLYVNSSYPGTFFKDPSMTGWPSGTSGIPTGWTVQDYVEPNP